MYTRKRDREQREAEEGGGKKPRADVNDAETEPAPWNPSTQLVPRLGNQVVVSEIFPRLTYRVRAALSLASREFHELNRRFVADLEFGTYVCSRRALLPRELFPRRPSLVVFETRNDNRPPYAYQAPFEDRATAPARWHRFIDSRPGRYPAEGEEFSTLQRGWLSAGSEVVCTSRSLDARGFVGRLGPGDNWVWEPTAAPPTGLLRGRVGSGDDYFYAAALVGRRAAKVAQQGHSPAPFVRGCYLDLDTRGWSYLPPLNAPLIPRGGAREAVRLLHAVPLGNELAVVGHVVRNGTVSSCAFDFEARAWSPWNGTRHLRFLSRVLMALYRHAGCSPCAVSLAWGTDANTLYAATPAPLPADPSVRIRRPEFRYEYHTGRVAVFFLLFNDATPPRQFRWVEVAIPPLNDRHVYVLPQAFALEDDGGVAVVAQIGNKRKKLAWWFVDHRRGVYRRGMLSGFCPRISSNATFALLYSRII